LVVVRLTIRQNFLPGLPEAGGVDLTFANCQPRTRYANVKSKTPPETYIF
jgi:hypothetical protein